MNDSQYRGSAGRGEIIHYVLASGSDRSSKLRANYVRISVQICDNAICVLNVLYQCPG